MLSKETRSPTNGPTNSLDEVYSANLLLYPAVGRPFEAETGSANAPDLVGSFDLCHHEAPQTYSVHGPSTFKLVVLNSQAHSVPDILRRWLLLLWTLLLIL